MDAKKVNCIWNQTYNNIVDITNYVMLETGIQSMPEREPRACQYLPR